MRILKIIPISVQQRVLAIHPETKELRTAKILTAAIKKGNLNDMEPIKYRAQFDRPELGVPFILDQNLVPIDDHGSNWDIFREKYEEHILKREVFLIEQK